MICYNNIHKMPTALHLIAVLLCSTSALQAEPERLVRTVAELQALAKPTCPIGLPVLLRGQVIAEPYKKGIILADATGGCYIENLQNIPDPKPRLGDLLTVRGETFANEFRQEAVKATAITLTGHRPAPDPRPTTVERVVSGAENFRTVRISGYITEVIEDEINPEWHYMVLKHDGAATYVSVPEVGENEISLPALIDCDVELTGVVMPHYCAERLFIGPHLEMISKDDIRIRTIASGNVEDYTYLEDIFHVNPAEISKMRRRRIEGLVLAVWNRSQALVEEDSGRRILIDFSAGSSLPKVGARIVAVGFPETDLFRLNLSRAICKTIGTDPPAGELPQAVTAANILLDTNGNHRLDQSYYGKLIRLCGVVRSMPSAGNSDGRINLDCDGFLVPVDVSANPSVADGLALGCKIAASGICIMEAKNWRSDNLFPILGGFTLVPRTSDDIRVLAQPPWWTPGRLLVVICSLFAALLGILAWNRALNHLVERRSRQLFKEQVAHAGADLKVDERTRLAVELHDSLSQTLTGVSFQIDAAERARQRDPSRIERHLAIAKRTLQSCREDLRNCLWDLRNNALEETDATTAIQRTIEPHLGEARLALDMQIPRAKFSDNTFHAILCVLRELAVNAVRHGAASLITITGRLTNDELKFSVVDNGRGFDPDNRLGVAEGHFGFQGITERIETLGGTLSLSSTIDEGTTVIFSLKA